MRCCLVLLGFLFGFTSYGQTVFKVNCLDKNSLEAIPNAVVEINNGDTIFTLSTNLRGFALSPEILVVDKRQLLISVQHPLYETQVLKNNIFQSEKDTQEVKLHLKPIKQQWYDPVKVKAPGVPDTMYQSKEFHVADFEITDQGDFILLVYPKRKGQRNSLLLFDANMVKDSLAVDQEGINLIKDYRNKIHLVCHEQVYHVQTAQNKINVNSIPKSYFTTYILPVVDSTTSKMFFSNYNEFYPAFDYFSLDLIDSTYRKVIHIEDTLMMELYRSEYKWVDVRTRLWAKHKELETGIDAQIWVGANYFTQSIYYKMPFAPMFKVQDSIYVFDFPSDRLFVHNRFGERMRSIAIHFHYKKDKTGWKRILLKDSSTGFLYAVFEKDGITTLGQIDLQKGTVTSSHRIFHKYVEKIRIYNGFVYYIYRPFESIQKRFLYKERLLD
jgi:hypothetical protein